MPITLLHAVYSSQHFRARVFQEELLGVQSFLY